MSFFRRGDDKGGARASFEVQERAPIYSRPLEAAEPQGPVQDAREYVALGTAMEEHEQSSAMLVSGFSAVQAGLSSLIDSHGRTLQDVGRLRAESARANALLSQETSTRARLEEENGRLASENREMASDIAQVRIEADVLRQEFTKLQALHQIISEERNIFEIRLRDTETELKAQVRQYDEAALLMKRAQQELDARSRELTAVRQKLETETTAHQLLIETSRRDAANQARELARVNEERAHTKAAMAEQETLVRTLQVNLAGLRQELSSLEERHKRMEVEYETLQSQAAMESAQMSSRVEAMNSKVILAEKLLATANGRNRVTDDELHIAKAELKRLKTDFVTLTSRSERTTEELVRARSIGAESESARRDLAAQCNDLTARLREMGEARARREREAETLKRDMEARAESDRFEISQLRTSLDIARAEARQLKTEHAILTGQLDAARVERARMAAAPQAVEEPADPLSWAARPVAQPIIDISESALRANAASALNDRSAVHDEPQRLPAE